jgi:hypothetical protein
VTPSSASSAPGNSLLWLIRSAAVSAVLDGTEKITKKALDNVEADITSQSPRPPAA